jgi:hypothetical protein
MSGGIFAAMTIGSLGAAAVTFPVSSVDGKSAKQQRIDLRLCFVQTAGAATNSLLGLAALHAPWGRRIVAG